MLRHSVLWILRDTTTLEKRLEMLMGLAYVRTECPSVRWGDYGEDLFGGSRDLREVPPSRRTPMWRRGDEGPPSNFDVALHLDFDDWESFREYAVDPTHAAASRFNESVAWDELTTRVDWYYDGPGPLTVRGHVRHTAMFVWADGAGEAERASALEAVDRLRSAPGVESVAVGHNVGRNPSDYDWIMDVQLADRPATEWLLGGADFARAMEVVAAATMYEWTARVSHVMRGP